MATMSVITDNSNNIIDPEAEVRKLQDLVKKLEQQNQLLRNKQNEREKDDVFSSKTETLDTHFIPKSAPRIDNGVHQDDSSTKDISFEDIALVELNDSCEEEDEWYARTNIYLDHCL